MNGRARDLAAAQTDQVETAQANMQANRDAVRNDIGADAGKPADESIAADAAELLRRGEATHDHAVADFEMPADNDPIREDNVVADDAIVTDMRSRHEEVVVADLCEIVAF